MSIINKKGNKNQNLAMVIVGDRCIGCDACYAACKTDWDVLPVKEAYRTKVWDIEGEDNFGNPTIRFLPVLCNHCDNPPCVDVCPTGASFKRDEDGIVLVNSDMCIGCKACMVACPYDARYYDETKASVDKCTFCLPRLNNGLEPACVVTCVGESRNFGDLNDPDSNVAKMMKNATSITRLKEDKGTLPNVYYITINY
ncbi:4Fe-4S dicluster domain-containing protein [Sulfurospirillum sp. 1612]|uniref:4Fe-4S dicluster domain-containing protein n=1 Tax=Sulfurospirillum sp. 1612 TaxID=3094835 RepID=UPI002F93C6E9